VINVWQTAKDLEVAMAIIVSFLARTDNDKKKKIIRITGVPDGV